MRMQTSAPSLLALLLVGRRPKRASSHPTEVIRLGNNQPMYPSAPSGPCPPATTHHPPPPLPTPTPTPTPILALDSPLSQGTRTKLLTAHASHPPRPLIRPPPAPPVWGLAKSIPPCSASTHTTPLHHTHTSRGRRAEQRKKAQFIPHYAALGFIAHLITLNPGFPPACSLAVRACCCFWIHVSANFVRASPDLRWVGSLITQAVIVGRRCALALPRCEKTRFGTAVGGWAGGRAGLHRAWGSVTGTFGCAFLALRANVCMESRQI